MSERQGLAIMVWSCGLDAAASAATPFMTAQAAAALELQVEMLFTAQAVQWLLAVNGELPLGFGVQRQPVRQYLQATAAAGVEMRACSQALAALGLGRDALARECAGLGGIVAFTARTQEPLWRTLVF